METTWSFADEHLHWVLAHTPATRLLPLAAVARQWHAVVAELMRLRVSEGDGQRWCAAMACGPARDFSTKAKARPACLGLLSRATRHALGSMRMLPDLAIVFVSDATKHANAVAVLNPAVGTLDRHVHPPAPPPPLRPSCSAPPLRPRCWRTRSLRCCRPPRSCSPPRPRACWGR